MNATLFWSPRTKQINRERFSVHFLKRLKLYRFKEFVYCLLIFYQFYKCTFISRLCKLILDGPITR